ncbi:MAG: efflux RND transporter periplasmic adaptor subunit [Patescibacteria group bacterium]
MKNNDQGNISSTETKIFGLKKNIVISGAVAALLIAGVLVGAIYWRVVSNRIVIDKSMISAPQIDLAAKTAGPLEEVFVNEGDEVLANAVLARVGNELIKAKTAGLIISVKKDIGQLFNSGTPVISMIDLSQLRVVGQIDENKGLADITVGQSAVFTVDAFGSQKFTGVVDEINQTSNDSGVAFSISDKREIKKFNIKVRFNTLAHPEFKNGMSAKITIYRN